MSWIDGWRERLRHRLRRSTVEREMDEELAFHFEREVEKNAATGMTESAARRAARVSFGSIARYREEAREVWTGLPGRLAADIRQGLRRLSREPGFTLVAALTLGLGIGANTAIFSLVHGVLLQPLPYRDADRLVVLWNRSGDVADDTWTSAREVVEYRHAMTSLHPIAAYSDIFVNLAEGEPERVQAAFVTANLFDTLGTAPILGRTFGSAEDSPGAPLTVVLGYGLWQRQFGADPAIVGREIRVSGRTVTVLGVMPADFRLPLDYREPRPTELFLPVQFDTSRELPWGDRSYFIVARLAPETSAAAVSAELTRTHAFWVEQGFIDADDAPRDRSVFPVYRLVFGHLERPLMLLFLAVGLLLLVACTNVAHLLLARGDARRRELATQAVLGASRARIATHLLAESGVLAVLGGAFGVAVAWLTIEAAIRWTPVNAIRSSNVEVDGTTLVFTAGVALLSTLVAGVLPALSLSRAGMTEALAGARSVTSTARPGVRRALVIAEVALSLMLVLCAGLLAQSYARLRSVDLGFSIERIVTLRVDLPPAEYAAEGRASQFFRDVLRRFRGVAGVEAAGAVRVLPLSSTIGDWTITVEHRPDLDPSSTNGDWQVVTPGYFEAIGMRVRRGRTIQPEDDERAPLVAVVSETMAERYWPGQEAVGRRFHLGTLDQPWIEIVGVAETIRHNAVVEAPRAEMYLPHAQWSLATGGGSPRYGMTLVARTTGDPAAVLPQLRDEIRAVDSRLPVSDARTMDDVASSALAEPRFTTFLLGAFAALALVLAGIGLYGVVAFTTSRRTREIGLRLALGARPVGVCLLVIRDSLALAAAGAAAGLVGSYWATRLLADQLYGVSALDPATFLLAPLALLAVTALATSLPAVRAVRTNPVDALRLD